MRLEPRKSAQYLFRLHGVELDPVVRELACLLLWLHAGAPASGPGAIADQIVADNAITRDWFADEPCDALIMNPPWDSLRHAVPRFMAMELARDRQSNA